MSFAVGDRLGRFEILGSLGAGGMGEVYRARDLQLEREVAIKVLLAAFSADPDRRRRFEQEARAAGNLNHPNILAVHDVGVHDGSSYIVTELLEGETLRQRMDGRPLPARKAVEFGIQIASGLAAGHERGIVHRDVKPDNLFVTKDGRIKILDFGLAKLIGSEAPDNTETVTVDGVQRGPVIGTVAYMSPEQARGLRVDHRSDIFSFGTVLYEMLAGFPPFRRGTTVDTVNAILNDELPDLPAALAAPPALERIIRHCLEKKPEERFQNVRDLIFDLETRPTETGPVPATAERRLASRRTIRVGAALLTILAAVALGYGVRAWLTPATESTITPRVSRMTDLVGLEESPAISPNAQYVAFTATVKGRRQVFVRARASGTPHRVTNDDQADHEFPRWTPDSNSLVYFSPAAPGEVQGWISTVPHLGGTPRRIMASIGAGDIGSNGRLACFRLENGRFELVTTSLIDAADLQVITQLDAGYYRYPRWSPDGRSIAFQRGDGIRFEIFVVRAMPGEKPVARTSANKMINGLAWLPDGSGLIYSSSQGSSVPYLPPLSLWEVRLDGTTRQVTVDEFEQPDVHEGVVYATRMRMKFDIYRFPFGPVAVGLDRAAPVTHQTGQVLTPTAAPEGDKIAYLSDSGGHANLWVMSTTGAESPRQITFETDQNAVVGVPIWSPDGRSIAYVSTKGNADGGFGIWLVSPDKGAPRQVTKEGMGVAWPADSNGLYFVDKRINGVLKKVALAGGEAVTVRSSEPLRNLIGLDGSTVYFMVFRSLVDGRPEFDIRKAPLDDGPSSTVALIPASRVATWQVLNPSLSPDGKWLAVPLTDGLTTNIWAIPTAGGPWRQVTDFGDRAIFIARRVSWSPDGHSIYAAIGEGDADIVSLDGLIKR